MSNSSYSISEVVWHSKTSGELVLQDEDVKVKIFFVGTVSKYEEGVSLEEYEIISDDRLDIMESYEDIIGEKIADYLYLAKPEKIFSGHPDWNLYKDEIELDKLPNSYLSILDKDGEIKLEITQTPIESTEFLFCGRNDRALAIKKDLRLFISRLKREGASNSEIFTKVSNATYFLKKIIHSYPNDSSRILAENLVQKWEELKKRRSDDQLLYELYSYGLQQGIDVGWARDLISKSISQQSRFDLNAFKTDHPDMYEKYTRTIKITTLSSTQSSNKKSKTSAINSNSLETSTIKFSTFSEANNAAKSLRIKGVKVSLKRHENGFLLRRLDNSNF
jgi:hypothetical protein